MKNKEIRIIISRDMCHDNVMGGLPKLKPYQICYGFSITNATIVYFILEFV